MSTMAGVPLMLPNLYKVNILLPVLQMVKVKKFSHGILASKQDFKGGLGLSNSNAGIESHLSLTKIETFNGRFQLRGHLP